MSENGHRKIVIGKPSSGGGGEADESSVRWLISYSDFMMQLVCLFILLYSVSNIDPAKIKAMAEAWRSKVGLSPMLVPKNQPQADAPALTMQEVPTVIQELNVQLGRLPEGKNLRVSATADGFRLQLLYGMFDEGAGQLNTAGQRLVDVAAQLLFPYQHRVEQIEIVGHTAADEDEAEAGSAMRLSLSRARAALRHAVIPELAHHLEEQRLAASGRGPHEPVDDNRDARAWALNRRVDFVIRLTRPKS